MKPPVLVEQIAEVEDVELQGKMLGPARWEGLAYGCVDEVPPRLPATIAPHERTPLIAQTLEGIDECVHRVLLGGYKPSSAGLKVTREQDFVGVTRVPRDVDKVVAHTAVGVHVAVVRVVVRSARHTGIGNRDVRM